MMGRAAKLLWVLRTFSNPLDFLWSLYRPGPGTFVVHLRAGGSYELRRNRWDSVILQEMLRDCPYLHGVRIGPGSRVVDIGAYVGDFAILCGRAGALVQAYEPAPDNHALAARNIARNRMEPLINLRAEAVGDGAPLVLHVRRQGTEVHVTAEAAPGTVEHVVPSVPLAEVLARAGGPVDLLKLDCEGFEYAIIAAAPPGAFAPVRAMVLEWHKVDGWEAKLPALEAALGAAGFTSRRDGPYIFATR